MRLVIQESEETATPPPSPASAYRTMTECPPLQGQKAKREPPSSTRLDFPNVENHSLPSPPAQALQEKLETGLPSERETATTTAAETPPQAQSGINVTDEPRMPENQHDNTIFSRLKTTEYKLSCPKLPDLQRPAGSSCVSCYNPIFCNTTRKTADDSKKGEEEMKNLALLRHSEVSFVCVESFVSLLAACCSVSYFGSDEKLQQIKDLTTSPFHCSSKPQIGLEEYLVKRIFKHGKQTVNEGIMAAALLNRFLCRQNSLLAAALQGRMQLHPQENQSSSVNEVCSATANGCSTRAGLATRESPSGNNRLVVTAARIGFIEFNYLTAHRLLLTSSFLARKMHRDDHTSIRQWAQVREG